jgi:hypothetical protein
MPLTNAPTAALYEQAGATSLNLSTDLDLTTIAAEPLPRDSAEAHDLVAHHQ